MRLDHHIRIPGKPGCWDEEFSLVLGEDDSAFQQEFDEDEIIELSDITADLVAKIQQRRAAEKKS